MIPRHLKKSRTYLQEDTFGNGPLQARLMKEINERGDPIVIRVITQFMTKQFAVVKLLFSIPNNWDMARGTLLHCYRESLRKDFTIPERDLGRLCKSIIHERIRLDEQKAKELRKLYGQSPVSVYDIVKSDVSPVESFRSTPEMDFDDEP